MCFCVCVWGCCCCCFWVNFRFWVQIKLWVLDFDLNWNYELQDIQGNDVSLSKYSGKVVLIVNVASKWYPKHCSFLFFSFFLCGFWLSFFFFCSFLVNLDFVLSFNFVFVAEIHICTHLCSWIWTLLMGALVAFLKIIPMLDALIVYVKWSE